MLIGAFLSAAVSIPGMEIKTVGFGDWHKFVTSAFVVTFGT